MSKYTEKNGFSDMPVNDVHWHISRQYPIEESLSHIMHQMDYLGVEKMIALTMEQTSKGEIDNLSNLKAIYLRDRSNDRIYAYGSLRYYCDERDNGDEMLRQIKKLHEIGVDGIKMLEGKNCIHEQFGCKLDGERYAKVFAYIEENDIPLLIHVADNVPFPHPENEELREKIQTEMLNVLERHPKLRVALAHGFNMTHDIERLTSVFEKYKNTYLDLTLGGDILLNFSRNKEAWDEFFYKYQDRILYGTDTYNVRFEEDDDFETSSRHTPMRGFFERTEPFRDRYYDDASEVYGENCVITPANMPDEIVRKIYYDNFIRFAGKTTRKTDVKLVLEYIYELIEGYNKGELRTCATRELPPWYPEHLKELMAKGNETARTDLEIIRSYYENMSK